MGDTFAISDERESFWRHVLLDYDHRLRRYLVRAHVPTSEVDEIISEVWSRALSKEALLKGASPAWSHVHALVRQVRTEHARIERREVNVEPGRLERVPDLRRDEMDGTRELFEGALRLLPSLPPQQRRAVELRYIFGRSFGEIGRELGIADATARVHALRGIRRLRKLISDEPARMP